VASAVGGIPEQVVEGRTGFLVPVGDARAMAERVLDLLADEGLRLRMGRQAAEDAAWRFGLERMVGSILRFTGRTTKAKAYRLKRATL
jgi:glycosyltransferase involved in cell wall biosynthesis